MWGRSTPAPRIPSRPRDPSVPKAPIWRCEIDESIHAAGVRAIRGAIADGTAYLVNHTTRFHRPWEAIEDPFCLYRQLVTGHNGGYHAYIETTDWAVACGSPELFFDFSSERLTARPMKGTAPRGRWAAEDADMPRRSRPRPRNERRTSWSSICCATTWGASQKPAAWRFRNCGGSNGTPRSGNSRQPSPRRTPPETGLADVFGALFPCASVTGAPKISAMAIIAEVEHAPRGVYCGAVGLIRPDPSGSKPHGVSARFAVGIRTAVIDKARLLVEYGSGGGITWDSSPEAEWVEVLIKTKALVEPLPSAGAGHGLIETMGYHPDVDGGTVRNLEDHLARLSFSAEYFGFPARGGRSTRHQGHRRTERARPTAPPPSSRRRIDVSTSTLENHDRPPGVQRLCVDPEPVASTNPALFHKTTDRRRYEERAQRHPNADDVVLVNERSELTETTRANLAVCLRGQWCTPPLDCGLLPGIERAYLIASGRLIEKVITVEDLHRAEGAATLSSLRGWRAAHICPDCSC